VGFDTPYVIGIIRAEEQKLLQDDEYTRMIEAPTLKEAQHVLVDTPYGQWIDPNADGNRAITALDERLAALKEWMKKVVDDERVLKFIQARYDGLNATTAILDKHAETNLGILSHLGNVQTETWQSVIWSNVGWEALPKLWQQYLKEMLDEIGKEEFTGLAMEKAENTVLEIMRLNAQTILEKDILKWYQDRIETDRKIRGNEKNEIDLMELAKELDQKYPLLTTQILQEVVAGKSSQAYEQAWDAALVKIIQPYRYEPIGYSAITAFWFAIEMEVKSVRLILTSRAQGLSTQETATQCRPLYLMAT
jgi:vacuolar-type H+-ATPase subunit C/Vma6